MIAAAGNGSSSSYSYPASYDAVVSVACIDENQVVAYFSQYNDQVEIAGPGVNTESTCPNNTYCTKSGTSSKLLESRLCSFDMHNLRQFFSQSVI